MNAKEFTDKWLFRSNNLCNQREMIDDVEQCINDRINDLVARKLVLLVNEKDEEKPFISRIYALYSQPGGIKIDDYENLNISFEEVSSGGYFVIKTDRWSFSTVAELLDTIGDFAKRAETQEYLEKKIQAVRTPWKVD